MGFYLVSAELQGMRAMMCLATIFGAIAMALSAMTLSCTNVKDHTKIQLGRASGVLLILAGTTHLPTIRPRNLVFPGFRCKRLEIEKKKQRQKLYRFFSPEKRFKTLPNQTFLFFFYELTEYSRTARPKSNDGYCYNCRSLWTNHCYLGTWLCGCHARIKR